MGYQVRKAIHIGRSHLLNFSNRQDAYTLYQVEVNGSPVLIGIVCDGCSEGTASEIGATLASEFLVREALNLVKKDVNIDAIPHVLYGRLVEFLRAQVNCGYDFINTADQVNFIKNQLLFTVVGFILTDDECIIFITGDGTILVNDEVHIIEQNNKPKYPAYHLVDRSRLEADASELPTTFQVYKPNRTTLKRLAIGSDAWHQEQPLLAEIWGFKHPNGLQRKVNMWSNDKHFQDDVSIIAVEITEGIIHPAKEEAPKEE